MGILGALVGAAIDRRDGEGGLKGVVLGSLAQRAVARAGLPLAATAILGVAVGRHLLKARRARGERPRHSRTT